LGTETGEAGGEGGAAALDRFDRAILALYHADTRRVAEDIGREVGLSAAAVQRRIRRLREAGVIRAEIARLDAHALGFPITCVVGVDVENERAEHIDAFRRKMAALRNVQQCWYVTGEWDFVVVVKARDMVDYERFTREVFLNDPNVRSFTTHVVMDEVKAGFGLPL
jgi:Lrp/AsnC family transcriptional regulator, leucine-responsive regulatory protein